DYTDSADHIVIDLTEAEIWDASTVATFDAIIQKFQDKGKVVSIIGLDGPSQDRLTRLSGRLSAGHWHPRAQTHRRSVVPANRLSSLFFSLPKIYPACPDISRRHQCPTPREPKHSFHNF